LQPYRRGEHLVIAHFGQLASTRNLVRVVGGVDQALRADPSLRGILQVHTYGGPLDALSVQAIEASTVKDMFAHFGRRETDPVTGVSGRDQILQRMRSADVLLLLHGTNEMCTEYIPSKLFEYLWMQRPILALVHQNPQMATMLDRPCHWVIRTDAESQTTFQTEAAICAAILAAAAAWRRAALEDEGWESPLTTAAGVGKILAWQLEAIGN
jgi:hypothetical protein